MDLANSIHMPDDIEPHHLIGHRPGHIDMAVGETETGMTEVGMIGILSEQSPVWILKQPFPICMSVVPQCLNHIINEA